MRCPDLTRTQIRFANAFVEDFSRKFLPLKLLFGLGFSAEPRRFGIVNVALTILTKGVILMKKAYLLAAAAIAAVASSANAVTLVSAAVFGSNGQTIWATANAPGSVDQNYTLFLQNPTLGAFLNPNDEAINYTVKSGTNYAFLAGDGFPAGTTLNSDPLYRLELNFDNGAKLSGTYAPGTPNSFLGGASSTVGNTTLTLNEFSYTRSLADVVGQYRAEPQTGDSNDYQGNFRFTSSVAGAVPEPASWALMLGGFGMAGTALRRRRQTTRVVFA